MALVHKFKWKISPQKSIRIIMVPRKCAIYTAQMFVCECVFDVMLWNFLNHATHIWYTHAPRNIDDYRAIQLRHLVKRQRHNLFMIGIIHAAIIMEFRSAQCFCFRLSSRYSSFIILLLRSVNVLISRVWVFVVVVFFFFFWRREKERQRREQEKGILKE